MRKTITVRRAAASLGTHSGQVDRAWHDLAWEHLADRRRLGALQSEARKKITAAVGVGPVIAATVTGDVTGITRFPDTDKVRLLQRHRADRGILRQPQDLGSPGYKSAASDR